MCSKQLLRTISGNEKLFVRVGKIEWRGAFSGIVEGKNMLKLASLGYDFAVTQVRLREQKPKANKLRSIALSWHGFQYIREICAVIKRIFRVLSFFVCVHYSIDLESIVQKLKFSSLQHWFVTVLVLSCHEVFEYILFEWYSTYMEDSCTEPELVSH